MTSHVANVIYATLHAHHDTKTLYRYNFSLCLSFSYAFGTVFFLCSLPFPFLFHIHVALLTLYRIRNQVYSSTRNRSRLNAILEGFLKTT